MADESGGGNPGPVGKGGIAIALIGAFSAVTVGMINGKVWPFNSADPVEDVVETGKPGRIQLGPETVATETVPPPAIAGPPTPVQTVRQFLAAADPEFDPATAVNRKIYVHNRCPQPMAVRVVYEKLDKTIDGLGESYTAEAEKMILPQSDDGTGAATYRRYAFVNARTADGAMSWTGRYPLTTERGVMNFRAWKLELDGDGDYRVTLDCDA